jgi:hypothetical protein
VTAARVETPHLSWNGGANSRVLHHRFGQFPYKCHRQYTHSPRGFVAAFKGQTLDTLTGILGSVNIGTGRSGTVYTLYVWGLPTENRETTFRYHLHSPKSRRLPCIILGRTKVRTITHQPQNFSLRQQVGACVKRVLMHKGACVSYSF